jgi:8-oxo-dGTP diphosphatase
MAQADKTSVAIVIEDDQGQVLVVKRPDDDESLPGVWGLPAASLRHGETLEEAAVRAARDKLGVQADVLTYIGEASQNRGNRTNRLSEYRVKITAGEPSVPQNDVTITQYAEWRYTADPSVLFEAARKGSLCSRIYLHARDIDWRRSRAK